MVRAPWLALSMIVAALAGSAQAQYRGMAVGWPHQAGGNHAAYYPGNAVAGGPAYYVARPTYAANYGAAAYAPVGSMASGYAPGAYATYMPVTAAYANPSYAAAYGAAPAYSQSYSASYAQPYAQQYAQQYPQQYAQQPATTAYYGPATAAYYAPAPATYAPLQAYRVTPAGGASAGAEAYAGYGQPTAINYVPPRFAYRTSYAPVPVYMYRPVTVYDPVTAQPVTCLQPATVTGCQTQRHRWFSHGWFSWLKHGRCGAAPAPAAVPLAAPTVTYCAGGNCQVPCGQQPYYPAQPGVIIPTIPAPATTAPPTIITPIPSSPAGPTVPPPGTRFPTSPADIPPSLNPGGRIIPPTTPGSTPLFPVDPSGVPTGSGLGGASYRAGADPYANTGLTGPVLKPPTTTSAPLSSPVRPPTTAPAFNPGIQPVPDPAAARPARPVNRAPQLLDPRDKTATPGDQRWGVVPAVWPTNGRSAARATGPSPYRVYQERSLNTSAVNPAEYDDSGWE